MATVLFLFLFCLHHHSSPNFVGFFSDHHTNIITYALLALFTTKKHHTHRLLRMDRSKIDARAASLNIILPSMGTDNAIYIVNRVHN